jgi:tRNA (guanosine-2'-O-)-methyltransferase
MKKRRAEKFRKVADRRQPDITVILENVTDMHNIGAVLRTCDSIGVTEVFVLNTEPHLQTETIVIGKRTSMGTRKWVQVNYFTSIDACFKKVREKYHRILGTHLDETSTGIYELDLTQPVALLFGNEHSGLSDAARQQIDGNFIIPQVGMAESLNVSVACAVTLYEAYRQRKAKGFYDPPFRQSETEREALREAYLEKHLEKIHGKLVVRRQG